MTEPWEMSLEDWKRAKGYEPFTIFEDCSPSQYAGMSQRAKNDYDRRRDEELKRNLAILDEHQNAVVRAVLDGKPVSPEIRRGYESHIQAYQQQIEQGKQEFAESIEKYEKARNLSKKAFAAWWIEKKAKESEGTRYGDELKTGFWDHVFRHDANIYWNAVHETNVKVPIFVQEQVSIDKRRLERSKEVK